MTIKERIEEKYGTVNNFVHKEYNRLNMSRTHLYKLVNNKETNPTIETLVKLAELLDRPLEEVIDEYSNRYRK